MNNLARAVVEAMAFLELSGDDTVDPDSAVAALEMIAAELQSSSPREKAALRDAAKRAAAKVKGEAKRFYRDFMVSAGLDEPKPAKVKRAKAAKAKRGGGGVPADVVDTFVFDCCGANGGDVELARRLLKEHPGLANAFKDGDDLETALHIAAASEHVEIVRALLDAGADVKAADVRGNTPLHLAAYGGSAAIVRLLLEAGAPQSVRNKESLTPAGAATQSHVRRNSPIRRLSTRRRGDGETQKGRPVARSPSLWLLCCRETRSPSD